MLFSMSGVVGIIVDIGIVVMILLILRMLKIPIITSPFGGRSVQLWNEQLRDKSEYLFSVGAEAELEEGLNKGIISDKLKDIFNTKGFPLFGNAKVTKVKANEWIINNEEKFIVTKEDGKLNICKDNNIFRIFWWRYIQSFKTGREWKMERIDKGVKKGLTGISIAAGEISGGTRETIRYCLKIKKIKVSIVAGHVLECPIEDLKEFIKDPKFKLRILKDRPKHHKTIIGRDILLEEFHPPGEPYKKALGIENAYDKTLDPHIEEFDSLFQKAQEIKSVEDLDKYTVCATN